MSLQMKDEIGIFRDYLNILSSLILLMITDYLLYKPVMLFNVFCGILVYANLVMLPNFIRLKVSIINKFILTHIFRIKDP